MFFMFVAQLVRNMQSVGIIYLFILNPLVNIPIFIKKHNVCLSLRGTS
jgi:hypothetical protein